VISRELEVVSESTADALANEPVGSDTEMSVKHGPVTLVSVVQSADGRIELLLAEGASVPGPILEIGNSNSRYRFPKGARDFVTEGAERLSSLRAFWARFACWWPSGLQFPEGHQPSVRRQALTVCSEAA
jgi:hypothetical protein